MNWIPGVVFDTNILFSALGWLGNPHQCVQAARQGKCLSLTCEAILAELAGKLQLKRGLDLSMATADHRRNSRLLQGHRDSGHFESHRC